MTYLYPKNSKRYSPKGIRVLFEQAVEQENGDFESVLKKRKYQNLREQWDSSFLALAIKKWSNKEFYLAEPTSDPPDVLFLDLNNNEGFGVEVMELFFFNETVFDENYQVLANKIYEKKGTKDLKDCHLLVVSRIVSASFNIEKLRQELTKLNWNNVERIWFGIFTKLDLSWRFFEIYPSAQNNIANISFSTKNKAEMKFYY